MVKETNLKRWTDERENTQRENTQQRSGSVLELELIQSHMAQKPELRSEVGFTCVAREVSVERGGMGERGCARHLGGWVWQCGSVHVHPAHAALASGAPLAAHHAPYRAGQPCRALLYVPRGVNLDLT